MEHEMENNPLRFLRTWENALKHETLFVALSSLLIVKYFKWSRV